MCNKKLFYHLFFFLLWNGPIFTKPMVKKNQKIIKANHKNSVKQNPKSKTTTKKKSSEGTNNQDEDEEHNPSLAKDFIPEVDSIIIPEPVEEEMVQEEMPLIKQIFIVVFSVFILANVIAYLYSAITTNKEYKNQLKIYQAQKGTSLGFDELQITDPAINQDKSIQKPTNKILKNKDLKIFLNPDSIWESKWNRYFILSPAYGALNYINGKKLWSSIDN